eukprot:7170913-Lingulodinium_polyedra.AAC.1
MSLRASWPRCGKPNSEATALSRRVWGPILMRLMGKIEGGLLGLARRLAIAGDGGQVVDCLPAGRGV